MPFTIITGLSIAYPPQLPTLDLEDVKRVNGLDRNRRLCNYASEFGKVSGWTYEQLGWTLDEHEMVIA